MCKRNPKDTERNRKKKKKKRARKGKKGELKFSSHLVGFK
jgi:hypothetical protein